MIKVANKKTIRQIADSAFRADKMRNWFAIAAISLTTVLFCGLFTIAASLLVSLENSTMRQVGTSAHGAFKNLTLEQYENLSKHPDIKEISYTVVLGLAENEELAARQTEIRYAKDELAAQLNFSMPTTGRLPEAKNEIAADTLVLEKLGVPARLGETVTVKYSVSGEVYTDSFVLSGFWDGDIVMSASQIWVSREYAEEILNQHGLSVQNGSKAYSYGNPKEAQSMIGTIQAEVNFRNAWGIESRLKKIIAESGYSAEDIAYGVNWAYEDGSSIDVQTMLGAGVLVLLIMLSGYLMISNVFFISVTKDVRFYGLLKTIGTTGTQIKTLIKRQAMHVAVIGIPIGLAAGWLAGGMLTPIIFQILNPDMVKVSIQWWVFLFAAMFAWVTVSVSIRKASKLAAHVSPIEALRTTDAACNYKKRQKTGRKISLWKMAWDNLTRTPKKTILVTLSLSLSLIVLNGAYTMANSLNLDAYLSQMISHDFILGDASWFDVNAMYGRQDTISNDFLKKLSAQEGVETLEKIYFSEENCRLDEHWMDMAERAEKELQPDDVWLSYMQEEIDSGYGMYHVYGLDDAVWEDMTVWSGAINLEQLHSGNYAVVSPYDTQGKLCTYAVGDRIEVFGSSGESRSCEIIAIASIPYNISIQHSHPVDINIFVPSDVFLTQVEEKCPMVVTLDVSDDRLDAMEQFLADYCNYEDTNMQYMSRAVYMEEYASTQRSYKLVGLAAGMLLAGIGIANFANTMITSILTRKREFAVLESIGMTVRQQRWVLILEGIGYVLLTYGVTWTIGTLTAAVGLRLLLSESGYFVVDFTILPSVLCMPVFLLLAVLIPSLSRKYVNRDSIVERLRTAE